MPRDSAGVAFGGGWDSHNHTQPPKSQPPEKGWREGLQQCNHKPQGIRCQRVAAPARTYCAFHDASQALQRRYPAIAKRQSLSLSLKAAEQDPSWADAQREIHLMQALLDRIIENTNDGDPDEARKTLHDVHDTVKAMLDYGKQKIEQNTMWDATMVRAFFAMMGQALNSCIRDERDRKAFLDRVKNYMAGMDAIPLPEVIDAET